MKMSCMNNIQDNILAFTVVNDRLGDIKDEMLHLNIMPFAYSFNPAKGHHEQTPGSKEFLRVERMIGDIQSYIKATLGYLFRELKESQACESTAF